MAHFSAKLRDDWLIELPEEARQFAKPGQLVDIGLPDTQPVKVSSNLAEFLGDFIGSVEGSGSNSSEDTGDKFAAHVIKKHRENHL